MSTTTNLVTAGQNNFLVYEGDTTPAQLTFIATDTSNPIDLSGYAVRMQIRDRVGGALKETQNSFQ